jgi:hypothetical protein
VPTLLADLPFTTVASGCERPQESQQGENEHCVHKVWLAEVGHEVHQECQQDCGSQRRPVEDSLVEKSSVKPANWSTVPVSRRLVAPHDGSVEVEPVHDTDRLVVLGDYHAGHAVVDHSVSSFDFAVI